MSTVRPGNEGDLPECSAGLGKQREHQCVAWSDDSEVPSIQGSDLGRYEPFGDGDDGCIDPSGRSA